MIRRDCIFAEFRAFFWNYSWRLVWPDCCSIELNVFVNSKRAAGQALADTDHVHHNSQRAACQALADTNHDHEHRFDLFPSSTHFFFLRFMTFFFGRLIGWHHRHSGSTHVHWCALSTYLGTFGMSLLGLMSLCLGI